MQQPTLAVPTHVRTEALAAATVPATLAPVLPTSLAQLARVSMLSSPTNDCNIITLTFLCINNIVISLLFIYIYIFIYVIQPRCLVPHLPARMVPLALTLEQPPSNVSAQLATLEQLVAAVSNLKTFRFTSFISLIY